MSSLIVEICRVENISVHPNADRLEFVRVKGWQVVVGKGEFTEGEKVVYFPPDSVLPAALANSPYRVCKNKECEAFNKVVKDESTACDKCGQELSYKHTTPGRAGVMDYCAELPKDEVTGIRPTGGRVKAARLRGMQSFGFILKIDPAKGDDPNWPEGADIKEHFGVKKWEPPVESDEGDAAPAHPRFHRYTDIEHWANFPHAIEDGEEVVLTEKIHGQNARVGLVLTADGEGQASWAFMAGSHGVNRREFANTISKFNAGELIAAGVIKADPSIGDTFSQGEECWKVTELRPRDDEFHFRAEAINGDGSPKLHRSKFWNIATDNMRALLTHIRDVFPWKEPKAGIVAFGELYGSGIQKMAYGLRNGTINLRLFDIAVNGKYINYDDKVSLCGRFDIPLVPILYRGPFGARAVEEHTSGPTTLCDPRDAGSFKGREGVVITPVSERISEIMLATSTNGRVILKSVSADYLALKDMSDGH